MLLWACLFPFNFWVSITSPELPALEYDSFGALKLDLTPFIVSSSGISIVHLSGYYHVASR